MRFISDGQERRNAFSALRERSPASISGAMSGPRITPAATAVKLSAAWVDGVADGKAGRAVAGIGRAEVSGPRTGLEGAGPVAPGGMTPPAHADKSSAADSAAHGCLKFMRPRRFR